MDVFKIHQSSIDNYASYINSFINIKDPRMSSYIEKNLKEGLLWPEPLIQLNPSFEFKENIDELTASGMLHKACGAIFRKDKDINPLGNPIRLYHHQSDAIKTAQTNQNYILTTGTGSGKSLAYFIPIIDHILKEGPGKGIRAIIVYPVNALANSQYDALEKFLNYGYPHDTPKVTFERYTGQEKEDKRKSIKDNPPDILITNYVMLELILTRCDDRPLMDKANDLRFLVLDELHTYRGRQGADVAFLVRRLRNRVNSPTLQCIGTSATLASAGSYDQQRKEIAETASLLFGANVLPENVIGETLQRATKPEDFQDPKVINRLRNRITDEKHKPASTYEAFIQDPLTCWLENTLGIIEEPGSGGSGRLKRAVPRSIGGEKGVAAELSLLTGAPVDQCAHAIREGLLAGYNCQPGPDGARPFAFRIHQFISRGGMLYATIEPETNRYLTVQAQKYVPGDRSRVLFPVVFCRECGREYYRVVKRERSLNHPLISPWANDDDIANDPDAETGYIFLNSNAPFPEDRDEILDRIPEDWLEESRGKIRVKRDRERYLPVKMKLHPNGDGGSNDNGILCHFIPERFRFCLECGISYFRQRTEFAKLSSLASEGRSTATTILSLATIKNLRREKDLPGTAKKLLSFTDNRQDASLQAGHFNDFVETGLLRSAIFKAVCAAGAEGLGHDELAASIFTALDLPFDSYASNPDVHPSVRVNAEKALCMVLEYRVYLDLKRGWRVTSPNLEQCGLLEIVYPSLKGICAREEDWENCHGVLQDATPETRENVALVLLNTLRRELAIKVDALTGSYQEKIRKNSSQYLIAPWAADEDENLEQARIAFPCSCPDKNTRKNKERIFISPRSGFGYYLRRPTTFPGPAVKLNLDESGQIIEQLFAALRRGGLLEEVSSSETGDKNLHGYRLPAGAMRWKAGDGQRVFLDPIRFPNPPKGGSRANVFFVDFYRSGALELKELEAREHTAQVNPEVRQERESRFKEARLPVMFCSPTMELGVDIKDLNVVNMRNIPPTPANYAQRSGRAGRSGQPALIFTYCSQGSAHDQYFFKRPELMVSGAVKTPLLDLANEDLVRAHIHAIWLAETGLNLGVTLQEILDLSNPDAVLKLLERVENDIDNPKARQRAFQRAYAILEQMNALLKDADWFSPNWLESVIRQAGKNFDNACNRWREKYRAAMMQYRKQGELAVAPGRGKKEKDMAAKLEKEARSQLDILIEKEQAVNSDYYSYRYFATEGFLPGYNFPRLPVSAYVPARRIKSKDDFLSRPRFLAISEFGPRAIIYHEGSRYRIEKAMLPVSLEGELPTASVKCCPQCGYLHVISEGRDYDVCEMCQTELREAYHGLFRLQDVSTRRTERINSDEEERLRMGFEIITGFRFNEREGNMVFRTAEVKSGESLLARLKYAAAVSIRRLNLGLKRDVKRGQKAPGFDIDPESGSWIKGDEGKNDDDDNWELEELRAGAGRKRKRIIPYVEDHKNCLIFTLGEGTIDPAAVPSLAAALKKAIQVEFQLEDNELAVEPLPNKENRAHLLFYEAAEGGAGVLRQLADYPAALPRTARTALEICHFNADTGEDLKRAEGAKEDCEAACYDCLMSYYNQNDHDALDRKGIRDYLLALRDARVIVSPAPSTREVHLKKLLDASGSDLEKQWLQFLDKIGATLPTDAQVLIANCRTRPDFQYCSAGGRAAVYIDGPVHLYPDRRKRDLEQQECLENEGYRVIRFGHMDDWQAIVERFPDLFGN